MVDLPAQGTYYVRIADTQAKGGAEYGYRLRISPPRPDFELRVAPSSIGMRAGQSVPITVYALRRDGFAGPIDLSLKDAPPAFMLGGARIPAGADKVRVTLTAAPREPIRPVALRMEGVADIGGRQVRREAAPCQDMMQAFAYQHLVPSREWLVAVAGRYWPAPAAGQDTAVRIPVGGTVRVAVPRAGGPMARQIALELSEPPAGVSIESYEMRPGGGFVVLKADPAKAKPGEKGNLIVEAFMVRGQAAGAGARQAQNRRVPLGCLPAIPFEIAAR
ncbi:MAG: hypothetical protein FJX72_12440 [Armatimonadetes bacterium]|nr:hypothetical protein [Armatimonadota bacterium]